MELVSSTIPLLDHAEEWIYGLYNVKADIRHAFGAIECAQFHAIL